MLEKNTILEILFDWNFWKKDLSVGIERKNYLSQADSFLKSNVILPIIGVRRAGKSYLMRQIAKKLISKDIKKEEILIINFEDKRFADLSIKLLDRIYETYLEILKPTRKIFVFLDEIHKVPQWEKWVRTFHELNKGKVIISGSSADLMKGELATLLTGRHLDLIVFPLSFSEFLYFKNLEIKNELDLVEKKIEIKRYFKEYLEFGGFPEVVLGQEKKQLLVTYFDDILTKDIEGRYNIREKERLRSLSRFYLTNIGNLITFNSLKKFLEITTDTIEKFSFYLEQANLIFFIKRFSFKVRDQEKSPRKVYAIDPGLSNAIGFRFSERKGFALENIVALELKRKQNRNPLLEIYYWKDERGKEVDFLLKENLKIEKLIQVSAADLKEEIAEREIKSLIKASEELKCDHLEIITYDYEKEEKIKGKKIKFVPLWQWLLTE